MYILELKSSPCSPIWLFISNTNLPKNVDGSHLEMRRLFDGHGLWELASWSKKATTKTRMNWKTKKWGWPHFLRESLTVYVFYLFHFCWFCCVFLLRCCPLGGPLVPSPGLLAFMVPGQCLDVGAPCWHRHVEIFKNRACLDGCGSMGKKKKKQMFKSFLGDHEIVPTRIRESKKQRLIIDTNSSYHLLKHVKAAKITKPMLNTHRVPSKNIHFRAFLVTFPMAGRYRKRGKSPSEHRWQSTLDTLALQWLLFFSWYISSEQIYVKTKKK